MKIQLEPWAIMPTRAHKNDAGLDLFTPVDLIVPAQGSNSVNTGVHVQIPKSCVGLVKSRSGLMFKHDVTTDGTIDEDYVGSIGIKLFNNSHQPIYFQKGDRIAQLVVLPCIIEELEPVDELEETERGENGFGSTGR